MIADVISWLFLTAFTLVALCLVTFAGAWLFGVRYIPHNKVGIVEKLWAGQGSLQDGGIIATHNEAGFQSQLLRGGLHGGLFVWQYRLHLEPLVTIAEGKIGYVYARDGQPLAPSQTLGRIVECNYFQDAAAFLNGLGERGRQRAILREGVYAINQALFVVITEDRVYSGPIKDRGQEKYADWQTQLQSVNGFDPVIIGHGSGGLIMGRQPAAVPALPDSDPRSDNPLQNMVLHSDDNIGVVTVQDGEPIPSGEIIAPEVIPGDGEKGHDYFQDPEVFLALGGRRGKQLQVLTDGTFFINRWFATIELRPKTLIPIGYVGVVVSYYGGKGVDVTGQGFRYGEQVEHGLRGVWKQALTPGKYALNSYALKVELVPTVNFVLRWITGLVEAHQYDKDLKSIELITADGYEPVLPLSLAGR